MTQYKSKYSSCSLPSVAISGYPPNWPLPFQHIFGKIRGSVNLTLKCFLKNKRELLTQPVPSSEIVLAYCKIFNITLGQDNILLNLDESIEHKILKGGICQKNWYFMNKSEGLTHVLGRRGVHCTGSNLLLCKTWWAYWSRNF